SSKRWIVGTCRCSQFLSLNLPRSFVSAPASSASYRSPSRNSHARRRPMRAPAVAAEVLRGPVEPEPRCEPRPELGDLRFRELMTEAEWFSLPLAIRRRFSRRLAGGQTIVYTGEILESWMSWAGWWLAQVARLIGGPLPLTRDAQVRRARVPTVHVASVVTVTEDIATGGPIWARPYSRPKGLSQVIPSCQRLARPPRPREYVSPALRT